MLLYKSHLLLMVPAICLAQVPARPLLALDATDFNFGKISPDTLVSHRFKASNVGNAPLTISRLRPTCGCTSTVVGKEILAPGESTELEVTFNPEGQSGFIQKTVQVETDAVVDAVQTLTFHAEVLPDVIASARQVLFQDLVRGDRRKASVKLKTGTNQAIHVSDVELSEAPWLGVATREDGRDLWVDFDLLASRLPSNRLYGDDTVALHLENPRASVIQLTVHWELRPPVSATPARVAWAEAPGQDLRATVQLKSRNHKSFRILSARTSNPLLQVSGISPTASASQVVQLLLSRSAPAGTYEEKAILTLDTPGHPEFEIRVAASLR